METNNNKLTSEQEDYILESGRESDFERKLQFEYPSEAQLVFISKLLRSSQLRGISRNKLLRIVSERDHSVKSYSKVITYILGLIKLKEDNPQLFKNRKKKKNGN